MHTGLCREKPERKEYLEHRGVDLRVILKYEGWNFNSGNY